MSNTDNVAWLTDVVEGVTLPQGYEPGEADLLGIFMNRLDNVEWEFVESHDWVGKVVKPYPKIVRDLPIDSPEVFFIHQAHIPLFTSKGGVVYSDGTHYYILAFDQAQTKVYAEIEAKQAAINWDEIETKLNASGNRVSKYDENGEVIWRAVIRDDREVVIFGVRAI